MSRHHRAQKRGWELIRKRAIRGRGAALLRAAVSLESSLCTIRPRYREAGRMTKRSSCCVAIVTCHNTINRTPRAWPGHGLSQRSFQHDEVHYRGVEIE